MSSIAVFLVLGGAAFAAAQLPKNSVGKKQLKSNAVTAAKIKKNAVTKAKIKNGAVDGSKVKDGSLSGADINVGSLGTVPSATNATNAANAAKTDVIKTAKGTLALGQEKTVFTDGPLSVSVRCEVPPEDTEYITARAFISSSVDHSVFTSWEDGSSNLGPATPLDERQLNNYYWADSKGPFGYDSASDIGVSATAPSGESFTAYLALASEKDTSTCWYWLNATIIS
jgi:hypothetical protein